MLYETGIIFFVTIILVVVIWIKYTSRNTDFLVFNYDGDLYNAKRRLFFDSLDDMNSTIQSPETVEPSTLPQPEVDVREVVDDKVPSINPNIKSQEIEEDRKREEAAKLEELAQEAKTETKAEEE